MALFGNTTNAHVATLAQWLRFGQQRASSVSAQAGAQAVDALQSEAFTLHSLKERRVTISKVPWERIDVSVEAADGGAQVPCVRPLYYACGPSVLRERRLLPMCHPTTPQDRKLWKKWQPLDAFARR